MLGALGGVTNGVILMGTILGAEILLPPPRLGHALERAPLPRLRAALHGGPVITGEMGGSRRAIVYHGDVKNTTSRLEQATRDLERQFLVSGDAVERLADLEGFEREDLGLQRLRGRAAALRVYAVTAKSSTNGQKTI
jgi:class 3 adenylate cyclase